MNPLLFSQVSGCLFFMLRFFFKSFQIGSEVFIMEKPIIIYMTKSVLSFHAGGGRNCNDFLVMRSSTQDFTLGICVCAYKTIDV